MEHSHESTDRLIGQIFDGRFRVDRFIASGGMGAVYQGTQLSVDKPVAIKVLHDKYADERALERFMREAQNISRLSHPNIVSLIDFGRSGETTYLVMEYIDGVSLGALSPQLSICEEALIELLLQTSAALAEAHAQGIIHRDLKPDNLLLIRQASGALQVKIVDFGIARTQSQGLTGTGQLLGTPWYMSPEQAMNKALDARSDLFSLGVIAFELITGRLPFEAAEPLATLMLICNEPTPPIVPGAPGRWPVELLKIVERLLNKAPEGRFEHALALIKALEELRQRHQISTLRLAPGQTLESLFTLPTSTLKLSSAQVTQPMVPTRILKPLLVMLGVGIVGMLGIIGYMLSIRQESKPDDATPATVSPQPAQAPISARPNPPASSDVPHADAVMLSARQQLYNAAQEAKQQALEQPPARVKRGQGQAVRQGASRAQEPPTATAKPNETPAAAQRPNDPLQERLERLKRARRE